MDAEIDDLWGKIEVVREHESRLMCRHPICTERVVTLYWGVRSRLILRVMIPLAPNFVDLLAGKFDWYFVQTSLDGTSYWTILRCTKCLKQEWIVLQTPMSHIVLAKVSSESYFHFNTRFLLTYLSPQRRSQYLLYNSNFQIKVSMILLLWWVDGAEN